MISSACSTTCDNSIHDRDRHMHLYNQIVPFLASESNGPIAHISFVLHIENYFFTETLTINHLFQPCELLKRVFKFVMRVMKSYKECVTSISEMDKLFCYAVSVMLCKVFLNDFFFRKQTTKHKSKGRWYVS